MDRSLSIWFKYNYRNTLTKDIHLRADFDNEGNSYGNIESFPICRSYVFDATATFIILQIFLAYNLINL